MLFHKTLSVAANTLEKDASCVKVNVAPGLTDYVWVGFPPGCKGLVHVAICHLHWQVWPWTPGEYFAWDGYVFLFRDRYPITQPPFELMLKAWNEDDTYSHKVTFGVTIEPMAPMTEISALEMVLLNRRLMYEHMKMPRE